MSSSITYLSECINPVQTAQVLNPMGPKYYLADAVKAVEQARPETDAAVKVTLSQAAQSALKG
jgi:hypothetical protein